MATSKKTTKSAKKSQSKSKKSSKTSARSVESGQVPPYGIAIREAIARGNTSEMKKLAASSRKWLTDAQSALEQLESSLKKSG